MILEGISGDHIVRSPFSKGGNYSRWPRVMHLQGWRPHQLPGEPVAVLMTIRGKKKKSCSVLIAPHPTRDLYTLIAPPQTFPAPCWTDTHIRAYPQDRYSSVFIIFGALCWTYSSMSMPICLPFSCSGEPSSGSSTPDVPHQCHTEGSQPPSTICHAR